MLSRGGGGDKNLPPSPSPMSLNAVLSKGILLVYIYMYMMYMQSGFKGWD